MDNSASLAVITGKVKYYAPGYAVALLIAAAAMFLSEHYTAPVMLYALLLGICFNFLTESASTKVGIENASKVLLRTGVALLGVKIGWAQVAALGWEPVAMIAAFIGVTIGFALIAARVMGVDPLFGFLSGGATAICGASAALALAAALPAHAGKERATLLTVIGVSTLSTLAMIAYPIIAHNVGLNNHQAGVFIGATIHDVAQVVGAGYAISPDAGDTATIVKLLRVAMLLPVILIAGQISRRQVSNDGERPPLIPLFVIAFAALVAVNSILAIPAPVTAFASDLSKWCLVTAIAAIGMKTRLGELAQVGIRPVMLMVAETIFLAILVLVSLRFNIM